MTQGPRLGGGRQDPGAHAGPCPNAVLPQLPADERLRRCDRLLDKAQFQRVFEAPTRSVDPFFTVLARPNAEGHARLGLAIAKKCARRAVDRNRLKRLVRESFRKQRLSLPRADLVVMCRRDAVAAANPLLVASLAGHWARIRKDLCASS